jgi:DNA-binding NarL/FixJ family response regulator
MVSAIRAVLSGQIAISEKVSARIVEVFSGQKNQTASTPEDQLSDRELEILRHYGEGWSTEEIGAKLHLSPKTVDVHRANIKQKLGLQTTPEFLRFAIKWNAGQGGAPS